MIVQFEWRATERILSELKDAQKRYPEAVEGALIEMAEKVMDRSVELTPVQTGRLRNSAYIAVPATTGQPGVVVLGYGAHHALKVHEQTEIKRNKGQAKFLETALNEIAGGKLFVVAKRARHFIAMGGAPTSTKYPTRPASGR